MIHDCFTVGGAEFLLNLLNPFCFSLPVIVGGWGSSEDVVG